MKRLQSNELMNETQARSHLAIEMQRQAHAAQDIAAYLQGGGEPFQGLLGLLHSISLQLERIADVLEESHK